LSAARFQPQHENLCQHGDLRYATPERYFLLAGAKLQQGPELFMRFLLSDPINIGTGKADIRQLAVAKMREFASDGLLALPGLKEAGDRCEHGSILSRLT
jgi:hypothetical protein